MLRLHQWIRICELIFGKISLFSMFLSFNYLTVSNWFYTSSIRFYMNSRLLSIFRRTTLRELIFTDFAVFHQNREIKFSFLPSRSPNRENQFPRNFLKFTNRKKFSMQCFERRIANFTFFESNLVSFIVLTKKTWKYLRLF